MADNPKLGTVRCPAGNTADVYQTRKRGRHFYTRCDCCGLMQGTGKQRQQFIWDNADFQTDAHRPSNVTESPESQGEVVDQPAAEPKPEASEPAGDFDPTAESEPEPESTEPEPTSGGAKAGLVAVGLTLLAGAVGVWMN